MTDQFSPYLKYYLAGQGLDTSWQPVIKEAKHWFLEPDNLYRFLPQDGFLPETFDFLYNKDLISQTKFHPILFKEWFSVIKVGGYLVIQFKPNNILNLADFKEEAELLMQDRGRILYSGQENSAATLLLQKNRSVLMPEDDINRWTFGIITVGKRNAWVEKIIQSIKKQQIPAYEIIICGLYYARQEPNIKYIHFTEKDDLGWITRKKNLVCQEAQYENIMITNDRIVLDDNWFSGMKKYGNYFESLGCVQKLTNGQRVGDWMTFGVECRRQKEIPFKLGLLDYRDWHPFSYVVGSLNILKKSVWQKVKWDESLFWRDAIEDGVFCHQLAKKGFSNRFNPFSSCLSLTWRHGVLPYYKLNKLHLGSRRGVPLRRFIWFVLACLGRLRMQHFFIRLLAKISRGLKIHDFVTKH